MKIKKITLKRCKFVRLKAESMSKKIDSLKAIFRKFGSSNAIDDVDRNIAFQTLAKGFCRIQQVIVGVQSERVVGTAFDDKLCMGHKLRMCKRLVDNNFQTEYLQSRTCSSGNLQHIYGVVEWNALVDKMH